MNHPSTRPFAHRLLATFAAATCLVALAACSPGGSTTDPGTTDPATTASGGQGVSTAIPSTPVTLTIAYCDAHPVEDLFQGFTAMYPNVTFESQYEDCNNFSTDIVNRLTGSNPPDITQYVDAAIQTVAPSGAILDLAPYAEAYGWSAKFPASELAQLQLSADGKVHGEGAQYGIPGGASFTGVFYNKALMTQAGIDSIPASIDEFEAALEKAKAAGVTPIALGSQDDGGIHLWGGMVAATDGVSSIQDWVNGVPGSTINQPAAVDAATRIADWAQKGYFTDAPNATAENDARANFAQGAALFTVDGSWSMGTVPTGEDFGFFPFPPAEAGGVATGQGFTAGFAISAASENADVAAGFLDWLASEEAAEISVGLGMLPVNIDTAPTPEAGLATDLRDGYAAAAEADGIVTFLDHATPTMHTTLIQGLQGVIAGELAPTDFVTSLQDDWDKDKG